MILKELRHFIVNFGFGQRRPIVRRGHDTLFQNTLLLLIRMKDLQKLFIDIRLALKAVLYLVHVVDGMVKFDRL